MSTILSKWRSEHAARSRYSVPTRESFFAIAQKYLPKEPQAIIVDIGAGDGAFAQYTGIKERKESVFLLDQNPFSVETLAKEYPHATLYHAPNQLPFKEDTVFFSSS